MINSTRTYTLPILPLKSSVVFPHVALPISINRPASLAAVEEALASGNKMVAVLAQKDPTVEDPKIDDLYHIGSATVIQLIGRFESMTQIVIQGTERIQVAEIEPAKSFLKARFRAMPMPVDQGVEAEALQREILDLTAKYFSLGHPEVELNVPRFVVPGEDFMKLVLSNFYIFGYR